MRSGASPVLTMCPPSITTTARSFFLADAMASTTRRKSRATRTSGSDLRNAEKLRSLPGGEANSAAATLLGRRAIGTVRTFDRSASAIGADAGEGAEERERGTLFDFAPDPFGPEGRERGPRLPPTVSAMGGRT